jgi:hypothetical protein
MGISHESSAHPIAIYSLSLNHNYHTSMKPLSFVIIRIRIQSHSALVESSFLAFSLPLPVLDCSEYEIEYCDDILNSHQES